MKNTLLSLVTLAFVFPLTIRSTAIADCENDFLFRPYNYNEANIAAAEKHRDLFCDAVDAQVALGQF